MVAAWPSDVNQKVFKDGFSDGPERNVASFPTEIGPPKERRRSTVTTDLVVFPSEYSAAEWASLVTFYRATLHDGVDPFTRTDPLTNTVQTFKFTKAPRIARVLGLLYGVDLELRRLP